MDELIIPTRAPIAEEPKKEKHLPNHPNPRKGRRTKKKMLRDSHGRNRVLDERREREEKKKKREANRTNHPEEVMWREFTQEVRVTAKKENPTQIEGWEVRDGTRGDAKVTKRRKVDEREVQPTPRHLIGVETHPVPEFAKSRNYPHQPMEKPSHLWADVVHASDADVRKGNPTRSID